MTHDPQPPHSAASAALAQHAMQAFATMVRRSPAFKPRAGQQAMAQQVADTLSRADLGECDSPTQAIAVVQAGTGVGKSAAYASTAVALALARSIAFTDPLSGQARHFESRHRLRPVSEFAGQTGSHHSP